MSDVAIHPWITFTVGEGRFAVAAADVAEVVRRPRVTRIPGAPEGLLGIAAFRGTATPIVSVARLLDVDAGLQAPELVVMLGGSPSLGIAVSRMGPIIQRPPMDGDAAGRLFAADGETLTPVNLEGLLRGRFAASGPAVHRPMETDAGETPQGPEVAASVPYLGLELSGQAYALPLAEVSEVLKLAAAPAAIAQADDAVCGAVAHRGQVLPIVDLGLLLGLEGVARANGSPTVIAQVGGVRIGLLVDRLSAVHRIADSAIDPAPAVLNRGRGEAQVQAIARLDDGRGLVALLSAARLFREERIARILETSDEVEAEMSDEAEDGSRERVLVFKIGDEDYGLPLFAVEAVARLPDQLTRVPGAPAFVEGVMTLRGRVTPVIDQRRRFGAAATETGRARILVTQVDGRQAGFMVDDVSEIVDLSPDQIETMPDMAADAGRVFNRLARLDGGSRLVLIIAPSELLDRAERDILAEIAPRDPEAAEPS